MSNENSNNQQADFSSLKSSNLISNRASNKVVSSGINVLKDSKSMKGLETDKTQNHSDPKVQELEYKLFTAEQLIQQLRSSLVAKDREIEEYEANEKEMTEVLTLDERAQAELDEGHNVLELRMRIEELEEENEGLKVIQHMYENNKFRIDELENALRESLVENEELYGYKSMFEEAESKISQLQMALSEALEENEQPVYSILMHERSLRIKDEHHKICLNSCSALKEDQFYPTKEFSCR